MSDTPSPEVGVAEIDAVLEFLPIFEQDGYKFGEWVMDKGAFPYFEPSADVNRFIQTLDEQNFIISFDWSSWTPDEGRNRWSKKAVDRADLVTIRKMLTIHIRTDRFNEGHLASVLQNGHITDILRRLKQLRENMR